MPVYPTLEGDVARAKEILAKGRHTPDHPVGRRGGGAIAPDDNFTAYELLWSFVEAIEAVGPKVCELALRHEQKRKDTP